MLVLLLSTVWCVGGYSAVGDTYKLVTSADDLKAGDIIAIASSESQAALGTEASGTKRRANVNISIKDGTFTLIDGVDELTLEGSVGKWYFLSSTKKYLTSKANNSLTYETKASANYATISISENNDAKICFPNQNRSKCIRRNGSYGFSHYDVTTGQSVQIYKKASTDTPTTIAFNVGFDATKTYTFTDGVAPSDYTQPIVTLSTSEATGKGAIEYTSSKTNVVDVDKTTGVLSFAGKTVYDTEATISAQFVATPGSGYANSNKLTYTVKNVEAAKPTLSFSEENVTVMQGKETKFTAPTLTLLDAEGNPVTLAENDIYYESLNQSVAKIEDPAICKIDFITPGTADIKATYIGSNTAYENLSATFTLIYKEKVKTATTVEFTPTANSININDKIFVKAVVKANDVEVEGVKVIYSASNDNVLVDETTGEVVGNKEGTSTITASFAGNVDYAASSNTFDVIVTDPNKFEVTFDFMNPGKYEYGVTSGNTAFGEGEGDVLENATLTEGNVTLKNTTYSGYGTRFYSDGLRTYTDNEHTLYVPAGYRMTSISFSFGDNNLKKNYTIGSAAKNTSWTGEARKVIIKYTGTNRPIKSLTVAYKKIELSPLTLNEDDNDIAIHENKNTYANVTVTRSMIADGGWYTFCVPFDIEDIATTPLKDAEIRKYKSMTGSIMNFEPTTSLKAMHAYLVKPTSNIVNPEFEDVFVVSEGDNVIDGENGYKFVGIYSKYPLALDGTNLFLGADNTFYVPTPEDYTLKALRGYFVVPEGTSASKMGINIDGETTSISALNTADAISGKVYNLNGQYVGNNVKTLQKGIYVVNGKKIIVK